MEKNRRNVEMEQQQTNIRIPFKFFFCSDRARQGALPVNVVVFSARGEEMLLLLENTRLVWIVRLDPNKVHQQITCARLCYLMSGCLHWNRYSSY